MTVMTTEARTVVDDFLDAHIAKAMAGERSSKIFDGRYTITNARSGQHRTFKVGTVRNPDSGLAARRIVSLLQGPDNAGDYLGFAFLDEDGIHCWRKREGPQWRIYAAMLWSLGTEDDDAAKWTAKGATLLAEGRCMVCGRALTRPDSIRLGIGPVCLER